MKVTDDEMNLWEFNKKNSPQNRPYRLWVVGRNGEYHLSENMVNLERILLVITQQPEGRFVVDKASLSIAGEWEFPQAPTKANEGRG